MRAKRNREVNIFSASVVDLFASGLGVFLIVAIIALVNQKKETSKAMEGGLAGTIMDKETEEKGVGENKVYGNSQNPLVSDLEEKIKELNIKIEEKTTENYQLKKQLLNAKADSKAESSDSDFLAAVMKKKHEEKVEQMKQAQESLEKLVEEQKSKIADMQRALETRTKFAKEGKKGVGTNFNEFEIGSKIKLENVHFYPGTENAIEPYASREVGDLAEFLRKNEKVTIEISGHIFETKEAIEAGNADDEYNLSGRRAEYVCNKLVEFGISRKRMKCLGYGATRPLHMTNDQYSEEAQLNRRVEVEILTK